MSESPVDESFLIAAGYHGSEFCGSQIQPMDVTVQGEIQEAVQDLGWAHGGPSESPRELTQASAQE